MRGLRRAARQRSSRVTRPMQSHSAVFSRQSRPAGPHPKRWTLQVHSNLRSCDAVDLKVEDVVPYGMTVDRAMVLESKRLSRNRILGPADCVGAGAACG